MRFLINEQFQKINWIVYLENLLFSLLPKNLYMEIHQLKIQQETLFHNWNIWPQRGRGFYPLSLIGTFSASKFLGFIKKVFKVLALKETFFYSGFCYITSSFGYLYPRLALNEIKHLNFQRLLLPLTSFGGKGTELNAARGKGGKVGF